MFKIIMEDMRHLRTRMEANDCDHKKIREELSKIRENNSSERVKMKGVTAMISVLVAGFASWVVHHLSR